MPDQDAALARQGPPRSWPAAVAGIAAIPVGLGLAIFGTLAWSLGPLLLLASLVAYRVRSSATQWLVAIGLGLSAGALTYIALGLLMPEGPSSGSGMSP